MAANTTTYVKTLNALVGTCTSKKVVVIVKPGCPHCEAATRKLLNDGVPHYVVPVASVSKALLDSMAKTLGVATFPRVFVRGVFRGGNSELQKMQAADLKPPSRAGKAVASR
jgi:glutaredoxin